MALSPQLFKGIKKKNFEKKSGGDGLIIKKGDSVPVQFLQDVDEFTEYYSHNFQEDSKWYYVPCAGEGCQLCEHESDKVRRKSYQFCTPVLNLEEKKVQVLNGPKDLAGRLFERYEKNPEQFLRRAWDIKKFNTNPVSYDVDRSEKRAIDPSRFKLLDIEKYLIGQMERYYGEGNAQMDALEDDEPVSKAEEEELDSWGDSDFDPEEDFSEFDDEFEDEFPEEEKEEEEEKPKPAVKRTRKKAE